MLSSIPNRLRSRTARSTASSAVVAASTSNHLARPVSILCQPTRATSNRIRASTHVRFGIVQVKECGLSDDDVRARLSYEERNKNIRHDPTGCYSCHKYLRWCKCDKIHDRTSIDGLPVSIVTEEPEVAAEPNKTMPFLRRVNGFFGRGVANPRGTVENSPDASNSRRNRRRSGIFVHTPNLEAGADEAVVDQAANEPMREPLDADEVADQADVELYAAIVAEPNQAVPQAEDPAEIDEPLDANEAADGADEAVLDQAANEPMQAAEDLAELFEVGEPVDADVAADQADVALDVVQAAQDQAVVADTLRARRRARVVRELGSTLDGYYWTWPSPRPAPMRS